MLFFLKTFQAFVDFLLVVFAFFLAYFFRLSLDLLSQGKGLVHSDYPLESFLFNSLVAAFFTSLVLTYQGRYSAYKPYKNLVGSLVAGVFAATIFVLVYFFAREIFFSRLIPLYALVFVFVLLFFSYLLFKKIFSLNSIRKKFGKKILVIGANLTAENLIKSLDADAGVRNLVGVLDAYGTKKKQIAGLPVLGKMNIFEKVIKEEGIQEIIQADNLEQSLNIVNFCERNGLDYYLSPSLSGIYHDNTTVYQLSSGDSLIKLEERNLSFIKKVFRFFS